MIKFLRLAIFALMLGITTMLGGHAAHAADYSNNHLMDDQVFDNYGTMSESDIQSFLAAKGPCLANYNDVDPNPNWDSSGNAHWTYTGSVPASHIIYKVSQTWGLNPQVIISTLQKEESLITGTSCDSWRYNSAMGYACPDSGGCNSAYAGFTRQVLWGSWQLKFNKERSIGNTAWDGDGSINYVGYMTAGTYRRCDSCSLVTYDGNVTIDGQAVHLDNGTTASLYTYTPHLNQSFPGIFEGWFGSVLAQTYSWQYAGQTSSKNTGSFPVGQKATWTVYAKNTGTATWNKGGSNPVRLGTSHAQDRTSSFATSSWPAPTRAATLNEDSVPSGSTGSFTFVVQPSSTGNYNEYFNLVADGITWLNDPGLYFGVNVVPAALSGTVTSNTLPTTMVTSATGSGSLSIRNDGNVPWYNDGKFPVDLGTANPLDRTSPFQAGGWLGPNRPTRLTESVVDPGQTGTFTFGLKAPEAPSVYTEGYSLVAEGMAWFNQLINQSINVHGTFTASSSDAPSVNIVAGQTKQVTLTYTNTGSGTWTNSGPNPTKLGTWSPQDRTSVFCDSSWLSCNRPVLMNEASVGPGGTATFTFTLKSSAGQNGQFNEYFRPVAEGQEWFGNADLVTVKVGPPTYTWSLAGQAAFTDSSKNTSLDLNNLSPGQKGWLQLRATNTGNTSWTNTGSNPIDLGTVSPIDRPSGFVTSGWMGANRPARLIESSVAPGQTGTFEFPFVTTAGGGTYFERFNLVAEGITWMNDLGLGYQIKVNAGYSWALADQYAYTDSSKTTGVDLTQLHAGQSVYVGLKARNTGSATWFNTSSYPLDLATTHPIDRASPFVGSGWMNSARPARMQEASVAPGQTGTFEFSYTAPSTPGTYYEYFNPVAEGITHLNDLGLNFYTVVH